MNSLKFQFFLYAMQLGCWTCHTNPEVPATPFYFFLTLLIMWGSVNYLSISRKSVKSYRFCTYATLYVREMDCITCCLVQHLSMIPKQRYPQNQSPPDTFNPCTLVYLYWLPSTHLDQSWQQNQKLCQGQKLEPFTDGFIINLVSISGLSHEVNHHFINIHQGF